MISSLILIFLIFLKSAQTSLISVYETNSSLILNEFKFNSPPYSLGNLNFPVYGRVVVRDACSNFDISEEYKESGPVIVMVKRVTSSCSTETNIFRCGDQPGCAGVIFEEIDRVQAGLTVWSIFDEKRERTAYKVPLVSVTSDDFSKIQSMAFSTNHTVALTNDPNPWQEMFQSVWFLLVFRIFLAAWCFLAFLCSSFFLHNVLKQKRKAPERRNSKSCTRNVTVGRVCLAIEAFCNLERFFYLAVDPVFSQQIMPYLASNVLLSNNVSGKVVANALMAFFLREVSEATYQLKFLIRFKVPCFILIISLVLLDIVQSILTGLFVKFSSVSFWTVKAIFFVFFDVLMGFWYLYERQRFINLRKSRDNVLSSSGGNKKTHFEKVILYSSVSMILFGLSLVLIAIPSLFGQPWGYFGIWFIVTTLLQFSSTFQFLLFGGDALRGFRDTIPVLTSVSARISRKITKSVSNPNSNVQNKNEAAFIDPNNYNNNNGGNNIHHPFINEKGESMIEKNNQKIYPNGNRKSGKKDAAVVFLVNSFNNKSKTDDVIS
eukprot:c20898_g1_i1.p1 GENE.c20898_g1_i1~~c20898_g1_i1.p1  ORF type:complete len:547 (+),score=166.66 c20898_g1_i1:6-1646(+)